MSFVRSTNGLTSRLSSVVNTTSGSGQARTSSCLILRLRRSFQTQPPSIKRCVLWSKWPRTCRVQHPVPAERPAFGGPAAEVRRRADHDRCYPSGQPARVLLTVGSFGGAILGDVQRSPRRMAQTWQVLPCMRLGVRRHRKERDVCATQRHESISAKMRTGRP